MKLIGGEMTTWSDADPVGGPLLVGLLGRLSPRGRVLVAGPHDPALLGALTAARVTCLVRSVPDATALADAGADVLCGTLAKLTDTDRYDLVIALDGLDRLCSVEGPQLDWAESLHVLRRALRPGGSLLLSVTNELGVHRLVDRSAATSARTDGAWTPMGEFDPARPANPVRLAEHLTADGLPVSWLAAAWPVPGAPGALATVDALRRPSGALVAGVSRAVAGAFADRPVLSDPRRLAAAAVRAGLGAELAPSWLVLAHRAPVAVTVALPDVLLGDAIPGPVPAGQLVEDLLLTACLRHDLPAVRSLLTRWAAWASEQSAVTTLDGVLLDGDTFTRLHPGAADGTADDVADAGPAVAVVAALRRFAAVLIDGGYAHPWPVTHDAGTLTMIMVAAAGLDPSPDVLAAATTLAADRPVHIGLREHEELDRRLRQQLAEAEERARWYETELDRRDRELRTARTQIALFSGSLSFRAAKLGMAVARRARRLVRRLRRKN